MKRAMTIAATTFMTTSEAARHFNARGFDVKPWQIRRLFERALLPEPSFRAGGYRLIDREDLSAIEAALDEAGYLVRTGGQPAAR